ncbi:MAG: methylated-DNA--[protein]-cysteine S-methyltransferase [Thiohalocapsa sp.]
MPDIPSADADRCGQLRTRLGLVAVRWRGQVVTRVELAPRGGEASSAPFPDWIARQLDAYCLDPTFLFSLARQPAGTPFQQRVWQLIATIPPGGTRTYADLAAELGSGPRAVGGACRANPYPLLVPCHRVVAVNGLGGFAGDTDGRLLAFKRRLLMHEGALAAA